MRVNPSRAELAINGGSPVRTTRFPHWPQGGDDELAVLREVITSGAWGPHGEQVDRFEARFGRLHDVDRCVTVANATVGLEVALRACGVGRGDEVIVPACTFIACATSILALGAIPVFVDVDPDTSVIDAEMVRAAVGRHTKAIMAVHYYGRPSPMDEIMAVAGDHGLRVIEDAAQAPGAAWLSRSVGTWGDLGVFSFQASKNLSAGEGGAIIGNDSNLMDVVYSMTHIGRVPGGEFYEHRGIGSNLRLGEFQGAILNVQLDRFSDQQRLRVENAAQLDLLLRDVPGVRLPREDSRITRHGWHRYVVRVPSIADQQTQEWVTAALRAEGIPCQVGRYRDLGLHRNEAIITASRAAAADTGRAWQPPVLPHTDKLGVDTLWLNQPLLLADSSAMGDIAEAVTKVIATG